MKEATESPVTENDMSDQRVSSCWKNEASASSAEEDLFDKRVSTCLKGVAIIMMLVHHCFLDADRYAGQEVVFVIPEALWNYVALYFKICVCLFVFISAYGLTKKLMAAEKIGGGGKAIQKAAYGLVTSRLIRLLGGFAFVFLLVDVFAVFYDSGRFAYIYGTAFPDCIEYFLIDLLGLAELLDTPTFLATYWYYSLAIVLILALPILYTVSRKLGAAMFLSLALLINFTFSFQNSNIWHYFLCIAVGIVCAEENWVTHLIEWKPFGTGSFGKAGKLVLWIIILLLLMILREGPLKGSLYPLWDAVIPVVLTAFCTEFVFRLSIVGKTLYFLGRYSMDIFLVHNYIRVIWFYDFTYSFRYPLIIVSVLLLISLGIAIFIEWLKKLIRYDQLLRRLEDHLIR